MREEGKLVYCFTLFDPFSEPLGTRLQGAFAQEGWFPFKRMQRSRRVPSGSPFGSQAHGPWLRCSTCQGNNPWRRTAPCHDPCAWL